MSEHVIVPANEESICEAGCLIRDGRLIAFPTETVYGLGADAENDDAVAAIFAAKGRPHFNPLIVHVPDMASARRLGHLDEQAEALADAFWPGALTLVVRRHDDAKLSLLVSAGLETVALRVPQHTVGQALLVAAERPIAAPSANRSGAVSPTTADHVAKSLPLAGDGGPVLILDGGACCVGVESTVVDCSGDTVTLLRPGGIAAEDLSSVAGVIAEATVNPAAPKSPGMLDRHYAPDTPLRMAATDVGASEKLIGFGPEAPTDGPNLSPTGDLVEAAANLFATLHAVDAEKHQGIAVMPIPDHGLGKAINDRLRRAQR